MEEYFSVFKAKNRARIHGTSCDILSLIDRFSMEKVQHKFCKSVLGIKKTSSNIAAKSELDRLPLDTFIKTQVILYFSRINCKEINPLAQKAFKLNKTLSQDGIYTWYTFAREILAEFVCWTFSMLNLSINDKISQLVPWILALFLALKTEKYSSINQISLL
jgi:CMP-2-keto-3-deoxyoctulosonic acid synthetase